jgi:hypothetical protein
MITVYGSMKHTQSGRKRKTNAWKTRTKTARDYSWGVTPESPSSYVRESVYYPSVSNSVHCTVNETLSKEERQRISSEYTIAPSYNKGAYQVIPRSEVKHIGR